MLDLFQTPLYKGGWQQFSALSNSSYTLKDGCYLSLSSDTTGIILIRVSCKYPAIGEPIIHVVILMKRGHGNGFVCQKHPLFWFLMLRAQK